MRYRFVTVVLLSIAFMPEVAWADDQRTAVVVTPDGRDYILNEMRTMLETVQNVVGGIASGDTKATAAAARNSGMAMMKRIPSEIRMALPEDFRQMAMDNHASFDALALAAEAGEPLKAQLTRLEQSMGACSACHGMWRLDAGTPAPMMGNNKRMMSPEHHGH